MVSGGGFLSVKTKTALNRIRAVDQMVWMNGLEPSTPCMSSRYYNQLSYTHVLRTIVIIPLSVRNCNRLFLQSKRLVFIKNYITLPIYQILQHLTLFFTFSV